MDERDFEDRARTAFSEILRAFDAIDAGDADAEMQSGVLNVVFSGGMKLVLNTQRPTRQIWMAGKGRAWHFNFDTSTQSWREMKDASQELAASVIEFARCEGVHITMVK